MFNLTVFYNSAKLVLPDFFFLNYQFQLSTFLNSQFSIPIFQFFSILNSQSCHTSTFPMSALFFRLFHAFLLCFAFLLEISCFAFSLPIFFSHTLLVSLLAFKTVEAQFKFLLLRSCHI